MHPIDHAWALLKTNKEPCPVCGSTEPRGFVDEDGEFVPLPPEFNPENLCSECFDAMDKKWRELEKPSDDFFQWPRDKDKTMDEIGWE